MPLQGIPNLEHQLSSLIEGEDGITKIRAIEWDRKYLWVIEFIDSDLPEPFTKFFPASAFSRQVTSVESDTFRFGQTELALPVRAGSVPSVSVTFYDDINRTLFHWIKDWMEIDILNDGKFVSGLKDSHQAVISDSFGKSRKVKPVRTMKIGLIDGYRKEFKTEILEVYPTGELEFSGAQASEAQEYTITFNVVGKQVGKPSSFSDALDIVRDIASRLI